MPSSQRGRGSCSPTLSPTSFPMAPQGGSRPEGLGRKGWDLQPCRHYPQAGLKARPLPPHYRSPRVGPDSRVWATLAGSHLETHVLTDTGTSLSSGPFQGRGAPPHTHCPPCQHGPPPVWVGVSAGTGGRPHMGMEGGVSPNGGGSACVCTCVCECWRGQRGSTVCVSTGLTQCAMPSLGVHAFLQLGRVMGPGGGLVYVGLSCVTLVCVSSACVCERVRACAWKGAAPPAASHRAGPPRAPRRRPAASLRPPGGRPAPSARGNFSQIPEPLRAKPPPRPNPRPPPICIIGLAAALPPAPAAAAAARDSLAVT